MALPKKKTSRARRDRRRAHWFMDKLNLSNCPTCRARVRPHTVCPTCGNYRGVSYLKIEDEAPKK